MNYQKTNFSHYTINKHCFVKPIQKIEKSELKNSTQKRYNQKEFSDLFEYYISQIKR